MGFWSCNIERKGRVLRLVSGLLAILATWILATQGFRVLAAGAAAFALICLFQAARGWCFLRALGVRTRW